MKVGIGEFRKCWMMMSFVCSLSGGVLFGQNNFRIGAGLKSNPAGLIDNSTYRDVGGRDLKYDFHNSPAIELSLDWSFGKRQSPWAWDVGLFYQNITIKQTVSYASADYYGFIAPGWEAEWEDHLNYAGIRVGSSLNLTLNKGRATLILPLGAQVLLPFACSSLDELSEERYIMERIFVKENFASGVFYGLYLKPTYEFKLSKKRNTPLSMGVFAQVDMLLQNKSDNMPNLLFGGGALISYRF